MALCMCLRIHGGWRNALARLDEAMHVQLLLRLAVVSVNKTSDRTDLPDRGLNHEAGE